MVAAVTAARAIRFPFTLTARAENYIRGKPDLEGTIVRLLAFEAAGADVLYAPGLSNLEDIRVLCGAVARPVNVLARPELTFGALVEAGAQRISVGGALAWSAVNALVEAATAIRDEGNFSLLGSSPPGDWLRAT